MSQISTPGPVQDARRYSCWDSRPFDKPQGNLSAVKPKRSSTFLPCHIADRPAHDPSPDLLRRVFEISSHAFPRSSCSASRCRLSLRRGVDVFQSIVNKRTPYFWRFFSFRRTSAASFSALSFWPEFTVASIHQFNGLLMSISCDRHTCRWLSFNSS